MTHGHMGQPQSVFGRLHQTFYRSWAIIHAQSTVLGQAVQERKAFPGLAGDIEQDPQGLRLRISGIPRLSKARIRHQLWAIRVNLPIATRP